MQDLKHSLISPNENFVVIQDAASAEGTKALTEEDRKEIRQQTSTNMFEGNTGALADIEYKDPYSDYNRQQYNNAYQNPGYGQQYGEQDYNQYEQGYQYNDPYGQQYNQGYNQYNRGYQYEGDYNNMPDQMYEDPTYVMDPRAAKNRPSRNNGNQMMEQPPKRNNGQGYESGGYNQGYEQEFNEPTHKNGKNKDARKSKKAAYQDEKTRKNANKRRNDYYNGRDEEDDVDPKMEKVLTILMVVAAIIVALVAGFVVLKVVGVIGGDSDTVLEEGMKFTPISISPEQAQFLETRKFQINEIARIFRVPPHMVGDLEKSSFSNIEQQSLEFVKYTLDPWVVRWESSIQRSLFNSDEKKKYFVLCGINP